MNFIQIKKVFFILFAAAFFFLNYSFSFAQNNSNNLILRQFPENPKEGEEVKLALTSDKYNLEVAKIIWYIDGQEKDSGFGRKTFTLKVSSEQPTQIVTVKISENGLEDAQVQTIVELSRDFILYEGVESLAPLFYKGRRLPAREGTLRVAEFSFKDGQISNFNKSNVSGNPENIVWKINGVENKELSGGSKILNVLQPKITDKNISVEISKIGNSGNLKKSLVNINLQDPEVVFKRVNADKTLYSNLRDIETGKSINLVVEPYFFSSLRKDDTNLKYVWKINNIETKIATPWNVVFSGKNNESVKINLDILNIKKLTQEVSKGFTFKVE